MNVRRTVEYVYTVLWVGSSAVLLASSLRATDEAGTSSPAAVRFVSDGHALGFGARGYYAAAGTHALRVDFMGANDVAPVARGAASSSGRVTYAELWDGITLAYDTPAGGILRSTYELRPGADVARIRLRYNVPLGLTNGGELAAALPGGTLTESAPIAWQDIDDRQVGVEVRFAQHGAFEVGFVLGSYDARYAVTIDPVTRWNTFLGGSGDEEVAAIGFDSAGNIYVAGNSDAPWGSPVRAHAGKYDGFIAKLDASGSLLWNTFLGGAFDDYVNGLAIDGDGNAFVTGRSEGAWSSAPAPASPYNDVDSFVAMVDASGNVQWLTFSGGDGAETGNGVALDGMGSVYATGYSDGPWGAPLVGHGGGAAARAVRCLRTRSDA
jgi:hypothetical protein